MKKRKLINYVKICILCFLAFFTISCSSTEIQKFFDEIANYEIIPENASNPVKFWDIFDRMNEKNEIYLIYSQTIDSKENEANEKERNFKQNKKTGALVVKYDTGEILGKAYYNKGVAYKIETYYKNGVVAMSRLEDRKNNHVITTAYYPNRQIYFSIKEKGGTISKISKYTNNLGKSMSFKGYYENGRPAMILTITNGKIKGKMYRKDGRVKFDIIDSFENYKTMS